MPGGDGTGPMGMGPMTGRAAGYCAGYPVPGYMSPYGGRGGLGRGFGRGFGRGGGRGFRWRHWATGVPGWAAAPYGAPYGYGGAARPADELEFLRSQAESMESGLDEIRKRIEELEKSVAEK